MLWEIDPEHTLVEFSVNHLMINIVKGRFNDAQGRIYLDTKQPQNSWVKASIPVVTIYTGIARRDSHLRSADFFNVEEYPTITFESTRVRQTSSKSCMVTGNLTLHGLTRTVSFQADFTGYARDPITNKWKLGISAVGQIDRRMFHMTFNQMLEAGISLIDYETRIELRIEAVQVEA